MRIRRRELWFVGPNKVELREGEPLAAPGPGQVKARALYSAISQGTELLLYRGEGPRSFDPSLAQASRGFPMRYGYCWVGHIVESGAGDAWLGKHVLALRPHGDEHLLSTEEIRVLPDAIPAARATLAPMLETAVNIVWDAGVALGDRVVVLGGGVVGLLTAMLCKRSGASLVSLVEPSARRRDCGLRLGIDEVRTPEADAPAGDADVVIEATGNPALLDRAIAHAAFEGTVVVASFYGQRRSPISLGDGFHRRRLQLKSSQVSHLPASKLARWSHARRFVLVLELLADSRWDELVEPPIPFDEASATYARLNADPGSSLHTVFAYDLRQPEV
jgi:2-desacetyl-2-hydroxyethyl bacteriochlorophyllide A dehydrogenase